MADLREQVRRAAGGIQVARVDVDALHARATRNHRLATVATAAMSVLVAVAVVAGVSAVGSNGRGVTVEPVSSTAPGWEHYPFGIVDPGGLETGNVDDSDTEAVASLAPGEEPAGLAVAPDGTLAIVVGDEIRTVAPDGGTTSRSLDVCAGVRTFDALLDAQHRLHLVGLVAGTNETRCVAIVDLHVPVSLDGPDAEVQEAMRPLPTGPSGGLLVDGDWYVPTTGDHFSPMGWLQLSEQGVLLDPSEPQELDVRPADAPDGLQVLASWIDGDGAFVRHSGWAFAVVAHGAERGRVQFLEQHLAFRSAESSFTLQPAQPGRRIALFERSEGDGWIAVFPRDGAVAAAVVGPAAADLHRAGRGFGKWTVGADDHLYWTRETEAGTEVVRYRHPLP